MKTVIVTGSNGLIGSEAVRWYDSIGYNVVGIDNNMRKEFFGVQGDTTWNLDRLLADTKFLHIDGDIRNIQTVQNIFDRHRPDIVVHCAAQPSHDRAGAIPLLDFEVNAIGTVNLLEATRVSNLDPVFIFMSTNKVYGDAPNEKPLVELATRFDYALDDDRYGIDETCRIDRCLHSLFGASKASADLMAQEYGRYYNMKVGVFRGGCLTGAAHSGVELHGFLSYLVHCAVTHTPYTIFGYGGKQVRDQLHSADVIRAFHLFAENPRYGEVYNLGGGRENAASVLECIELVEAVSGRKIQYKYSDQPRRGDHQCYITDFRKFQSHFPEWNVSRSLINIVEEIVDNATLKQKI